MVSVVIVWNWPLGSEYVATAKAGDHFKWLTIRNGCSLHFYEEEGCELVPNLLPPVLWEMFTKSGTSGMFTKFEIYCLLCTCTFIHNCQCGPVGSNRKKCSHGSIFLSHALWDWTHQLEWAVVIPICKEGCCHYLSVKKNSEVVVIYHLYEVTTLLCFFLKFSSTTMFGN